MPTEFVHLSGPLEFKGNPLVQWKWIDFLKFERAVDKLLYTGHRYGWVIAGGSLIRAVTGQAMSDIDIFCYGGSYAAQVKAVLGMGGELIDDEPGSTKNHTKYRVNVFIARGVRLPVVFDVIDCGDAASPVEAIGRFDFRCLKMYYDGYNLHGDPNALGDIALKRLVFDRPVSKRRVNKYAELGFTPDPVSVDRHGYTSDSDPWWKHFGYTSDPHENKLKVPPGGKELLRPQDRERVEEDPKYVWVFKGGGTGELVLPPLEQSPPPF